VKTKLKYPGSLFKNKVQQVPWPVIKHSEKSMKQQIHRLFKKH